MSVIEITAENFDAIVLQSPVPVLLDVFADYCGPCHAMRPIVQELADELQGKAKVVVVDVEKNADLAEELGIFALPTFIVFTNGKQVVRFVGMQSAKTLRDAIGP